MESAEHSLLAVRHADPSRPYVIGQLGQSLDGRIALPSGESRYINGPAALDHLHRLRAEVDAVIVGIGTIIADDPQLTVRRVRGRNPARVIIDPNCRLAGGHRCLSDAQAEVIVLRREGCNHPLPSGARALSVPAPGPATAFACKSIVDTLFAAGLKRILVEGGATTVSRFLEEGQLDRLHVLVGPVLLGAGKTGINLQTVGRLDDAPRISAQIYRFEGGDVLFDCDLRHTAMKSQPVLCSSQKVES